MGTVWEVGAFSCLMSLLAASEATPSAGEFGVLLGAELSKGLACLGLDRGLGTRLAGRG
jgi:hypothetical protein